MAELFCLPRRQSIMNSHDCPRVNGLRPLNRRRPDSLEMNVPGFKCRSDES